MQHTWDRQESKFQLAKFKGEKRVDGRHTRRFKYNIKILLKILYKDVYWIQLADGD